MKSHVGVDWASGVWVVVEATKETASVSAEPSLLNVWRKFGDRAMEILVDIPVHLSSDGDRQCDQEAKEFLESRSNTVFWTPNREAIEAGDYETAVEANTRGIGSQSWGLLPRIREVRALLDELDGADEKVFESRPEVCFKSFHGDAIPSKKTEEGVQRRMAYLVENGGEAFEPVLDFVNETQINSHWHHRIQAGRVDDVLDAAVLALTARESAGSYSTLPPDADPSCDPSIVYPGK